MKKKDKKEVVFQSLQIESLLWGVVKDANTRVNGDGCSIFLREEGTTRYILRDSTVMNPFLGNYFFTVAPDEQLQERIGATKYAVMSAFMGKETEPPVPDLRGYEYWSKHGLSDQELLSKSQGECELPHHEVGPFLAVPLINDKKEVVGAIRVVKRRGEQPFTQDDQQKIEELIREYLPKISGASDISHLLEIGFMLDLKSLCRQIVHVLTKMLRGRGCSIYLLTGEKDGAKIYRCMGTTGLHKIQQGEIPREIKDPYNEAYYEYTEGYIPQHLTTAVIKHRRNIITDDVMKFDPGKVFPDINRTSAKYWETCWKNNPLELVPAGPSIFVPLFSPRREEDVLGVIVINRPQGEKPFSPQEFRLCLSLSERLSKIMLYSRFMSFLNQPLTTSDSARLKESFDSLIAQICEVSGAPGSTLFIKSNNKLISRCSYGMLKDNEIVYELPSSPSEYGSPPYIGYTTWVAVFKEILKFNNPGDLKSKEWDKAPVHSNKGECEVKPTKPDRFLAVPIIGTNGELLGVLRTAKTNADVPFTPSDEMLFSSLSARLSPVIESISTLERLERIKRSQLEEIFAKELKDKLEETFTSDFKSTSFITKRIREFFTIDPLDERDIGTRILESIRSVWNDSKILITEKAAPLESFKFFDEQILAELPDYRDHFIHQYQVFLLGYYIIEMLNKLGQPFSESYSQSLAPFVIEAEEKDKVANIAWVVTSTFHDIAYPLEEIKRWLPKIIVDFLGKEGEEITPEVPIEKIFFQTQTYLNFVNELAGFFNKIGFIPEIREADFRAWLQSEAALNKDHGVLSSLILLTPHFLRKKEIILPSALAIALHKRLGLKVKTKGGKIGYDKFPLFFLLLYCDLVHEWNRDPKDRSRKSTVFLKKIIVTNKFSEIEGAKSNIPQEVMDNKETIYVHSEIIVASGAQQKIEECEDWFSFIYSTNPYFSIKINDEFVPKREKVEKDRKSLKIT